MTEEDRTTDRTDTAAGNPDWNRTIPDDEAQATAREADPDDLGSTSATDNSLTAGGEATDVGVGDDGSGGTPYTSGYVTGGAHHPTIADLPDTSE